MTHDDWDVPLPAHPVIRTNPDGEVYLEKQKEMPYEKLLAKLAYTPHTDPNGKNMYAALKAIVELHKEIPAPHCVYLNCCDTECKECVESYPCPTIQAIEKELG